MADLFVRHSLNSNKAIKISISFRCFVAKESGGDHIWTLELGTTELDINNEIINPVRIHVIDVDTIDELIDDKIALIAKQVDWAPFANDTEAPVIKGVFPLGKNALIGSNVTIQIKDELPASGIDLLDLNITMDIGDTVFDITSECVITGNPYEYKVVWTPRIRVSNTYQ